MSGKRNRWLLLLAVIALMMPLIAACGDDDDDDDDDTSGQDIPTATVADADEEATEPEEEATEEATEEDEGEATEEATEADEGDETPTEAEGEATEAETEEPVEDETPTEAAGGPGEGEALKIGVLMPFTGDLSDFGAAFAQAAEMAVAEINEAGGVNGQPVEIAEGDSGTAPTQGVEEARRLIEVEGVHAIVGPASSGVVLQVVESVTGPEGITLISPSATSPALTVAQDNDFFFRTTLSDAAQGVILADLAVEQGYESACVMYVNNAYGQGLAESFAQNFTEAGGTVTDEVPHEQEQASYSSEIATCTEDDPDVMVAASYPESAGVYLREAIESGAIDQFLFTDGTKAPEMFNELGAENFEGMMGTAPGSVESDAGEQFNEAFENMFGAPPAIPYLRETYDAVYLIALAAEMADSTDPTAIRDALREVSNAPEVPVNPGVQGWAAALEALEEGMDVNFEGASGSTEFDENGDILQGVIEVWQVEGGEIVTVENREFNLTASS